MAPLQRHAGVLDDLGPHGALVLDERLGLGRAAAAGIKLKLAEARLDVRLLQRGVDCPVKLFDDRHLGLGRRTDGVPGLRHDLRIAGLRHGGDVRQHVDAFVGRHREHARLAALVQLIDRRELDEAEIDMAGDQIGQSERRALVGQVHQLGAGEAHEQFGREVRRGADALRSIIELAGVGLGVGNEFLHGLGRKILPHHQHVRNARHHGGDLEAGRIEIELLVERAIDRQRRRRRRQQRVAVRRGLIHDLGADIATRARVVLDDERLAETRMQLVGDDAGRGVDAAARRDVDDDLHRPGRVILRAGCRCGEQLGNEQCRYPEHKSPPDLFIFSIHAGAMDGRDASTSCGSGRMRLVSRLKIRAALRPRILRLA